MIHYRSPGLLLKTGLIPCIIIALCSAVHLDPGKQAAEARDTDTLDIRITDNKQFQVMDNFGARDAWSCQYVGLWADSVKSKIADLLFSQKMSEKGDPLGIGLSAWRFNIGAGSAEQGDQSGIKDHWRRAESFLLKDGGYDFEKAKGQMWFLQAAKKRGVKDFIGFCNSAPYSMTINAKTYSDGGKTNLVPAHYAEFANYLIQVIKGVKKVSGVLLNYISPVNEPQWDWSDGGQEGSPYLNTEIAALVRKINGKLVANKIPTKISVAEAGEIDYLYTEGNKPERGTQIQQFLMPGSDNSLLGLSGVSHKISAHSYFTTSPFSKGRLMREKISHQIYLAKKRSGMDDMGYWMSEYCILGDNAGEMDGNHRDLGMASALYLAKVVYMDLCYANASAWHWWLAISPYDYKDGLIYVDKSSDTGKYYESKMLWVLGNYSRFIRPGYIRIADSIIHSSDQDPNVLISSFKDATSKKLVVVGVNNGQAGKMIKLESPKQGYHIKDLYVTSQKYNLHHILINEKNKRYIMLPAQSVMTMTGNLK